MAYLYIDDQQSLNSLRYNSIKVYVSYTVDVSGAYRTLFMLTDQGNHWLASHWGGDIWVDAGGVVPPMYKTITGLKPKTGYGVTVYLYKVDEYGNLTNIPVGTPQPMITFTTPALPYPTGTIYIDDQSSLNTLAWDSITVYANFEANADAIYRVRFTLVDAYNEWLGQYWSGDINATENTPTGPITHYISPLRPYTNYGVIAELYRIENGNIIQVSIGEKPMITFKTPKPPYPKPPYWQWSEQVQFDGVVHPCPIVAGGSVPTEKMYNGVYNAYFMGATEWNNFCENINKLRLYLGFPERSFTTVVAGYSMYPYQINEGIDGLNGLGGTSMSYVQDGKEIGASTFIKLRDSYNTLRNRY